MSYITAWKRVIRACNEGEDILISIERGIPVTPEKARGEFLRMLHNRINERGGIVIPGKKEYPAKALRDKFNIVFARMGGIVKHFETKEVRKRFSHLLSK
jgi:hypothetical protein